MKKLRLLVSHGAMLLLGFALGIYLLPVIIQPAAPDIVAIESALDAPIFTATFERGRQGSDALHW